MRHSYLRILFLATTLIWTAPVFSQDWPHSVAEWDDADFQSRVRGAYDWFGSSPERLETFEFVNGYLDRPFAYYRLSTVNREVEYFPSRVQIDPDLRFAPPPKDWMDREMLINYLSRNAEIESGFFEDRLLEEAGADTHYLMGNIYFLQGKFESAIVSYRQAIQQFPRFRLAYTNMSYAYFKLGDCEEALIAARLATEFRAFNAYLKGIEGYCLSQQGEYYSAKESFAVSRMLDPENSIWIELELEALIESGSYRQVEKILAGEGANSIPTDKFYMYLADIYRGADKQQDLLAILEIKRRLGLISQPELLELSGIKISNGVSSLLNNGELLAYTNYITPTPHEFQNVVNDKANVDGWQATAELISEMVSEIESSANKPTTELLVQQARALSEAGRAEEAASLLESLLVENPLHCDALLQLVQTQWQLEAGAFAETYLVRAENSSPECRDRAWRLNASFLLEQGEYAESLNLYQRIERGNAITGAVESASQVSMTKALTDLVQLKSL